jgi:hypothetical protein
MSEGKGGDELYTPSSIVRLLAEAARRATWIGERQPHGETVSTAKTLLKP